MKPGLPLRAAVTTRSGALERRLHIAAVDDLAVEAEGAGALVEGRCWPAERSTRVPMPYWLLMQQKTTGSDQSAAMFMDS